MSVSTKILTFPYHDPEGSLNDLIMRSLRTLQGTFESICISATPKTCELNGDFLEFLAQNGCKVHKNKAHSSIGEHFRAAMQLALDHAHPMDIIHYLYIDRLLFAIHSEYQKDFYAKISGVNSPCTLWERSEAAWATHPKNYRDIEKATNVFAKYLLGEEIELGSCGMSLRGDLLAKVLPHSQAKGMDAATEWILTSYALGHKPTRHQVDWLAWEDPFIEGVDAEVLRKARENSAEETYKRLHMNAPFALLTSDERFAGLLER